MNWMSFMVKLTLIFYGFIFVCVQGRRADLEMQQKQGKENPQELQYKQHCAWLW